MPNAYMRTLVHNAYIICINSLPNAYNMPILIITDRREYLLYNIIQGRYKVIGTLYQSSTRHFKIIPSSQSCSHTLLFSSQDTEPSGSDCAVITLFFLSLPSVRYINSSPRLQFLHPNPKCK